MFLSVEAGQLLQKLVITEDNFEPRRNEKVEYNVVQLLKSYK